MKLTSNVKQTEKIMARKNTLLFDLLAIVLLGSIALIMAGLSR